MVTNEQSLYLSQEWLFDKDHLLNPKMTCEKNMFEPEVICERILCWTRNELVKEYMNGVNQKWSKIDRILLLSQEWLGKEYKVESMMAWERALG